MWVGGWVYNAQWQQQTGRKKGLGPAQTFICNVAVANALCYVLRGIEAHYYHSDVTPFHGRPSSNKTDVPYRLMGGIGNGTKGF